MHEYGYCDVSFVGNFLKVFILGDLTCAQETRGLRVTW